MDGYSAEAWLTTISNKKTTYLREKALRYVVFLYMFSGYLYET